VARVLLDRQVPPQDLVDRVAGHVEDAAAEDDDQPIATEPRKAAYLATQRLPEAPRVCTEHTESITNYN
jgi:hypothetical protein